MIQYTRHTLDNGLTVICNTDHTTPFVSVNTLYKVGARDENPDRTGLAHLFEHLMFSGSRHVDNFDIHVQRAGGESNAYTTNDCTCYYTIVPAANIETALWLESDRMAALKLSRRSLDIQKNVVIEEFKQQYLNRPYGDLWLQLRPLAYKVHPYRSNTIGIEPAHVQRVTLADVKAFASAYYNPGNAIIAISGNIHPQRAIELVKRWFGDIPPANTTRKPYPAEPPQQQPRRLENHGKPVPSDMICIAYHAGARLSDNFHACDILSDILANGDSSRLYIDLVKQQPLFSAIDAYLTGEIDPGLFIFQGKLAPGTSIERAEKAILEEIERLLDQPVTARELQKAINKTDTRLSCSEISYQDKAARLARFEHLGNIELVNTERARYQAFTPETLGNVARETLRHGNSSTLIYLSHTRHEKLP